MNFSNELDNGLGLHSANKLSPLYHRPGSLTGYTGYYAKHGSVTHELEQSCDKFMIRGYTGFRPYRRSAIGEPVVPSLDKQSFAKNSLLTSEYGNTEYKSPIQTTSPHYRTYMNHVDLIERYNNSIEQLLQRGQTQQMLLRIVQSKMSEKVHSYSSQVVRTRKIFEALDLNTDGGLDENKFRICLEKMNIQLDDVQCLALFAYFDENNDGFIEWQDFADLTMVQNPKGGSAVVPKMITTFAKTKESDLSNIRDIPFYLHHTKLMKK